MQATEGSSKEKKVLEVSSSALVGLKAALFNKQQAAQREKTNRLPTDKSYSRKVSERTASIWKRTNKKAKNTTADRKTGESTKSLSLEEENALERSRRALEAKAALYDQLSKGQGLKEDDDQEETSRYMVDFTRKIYHDIQQKRVEDPTPVSQGGESPANQVVGAGESPRKEEEWVEYEDEFGRTRKCLKSELAEKTNELSTSPDLLSDDMRMERERANWERETEENKPIGPVHYQSVQSGEVRNLGVGYYKFSEGEEERQKQMKMLDQLRDETANERDKKQQLKEKRKALLAARLTKVKEKRNEQRRAQGLPEIEFDINPKEESEPTNDIKSFLDAELEKSKVNSELEQEKKDMEERASHVRPWDKGKQVIDVIKKRKQELEDERLEEFAPPSAYREPEKKLKLSETETTEKPASSAHKPASLPPSSTALPPNAVPPMNVMGPMYYLPPPPGFYPFPPPPPPGFPWQAPLQVPNQWPPHPPSTQ